MVMKIKLLMIMLVCCVFANAQVLHDANGNFNYIQNYTFKAGSKYEIKFENYRGRKLKIGNSVSSLSPSGDVVVDGDLNINLGTSWGNGIEIDSGFKVNTTANLKLWQESFPVGTETRSIITDSVLNYFPYRTIGVKIYSALHFMSFDTNNHYDIIGFDYYETPVDYLGCLRFNFYNNRYNRKNVMYFNDPYCNLVISNSYIPLDGTTRLYVDGDICASRFITSSDKILNSNVEQITDFEVIYHLFDPKNAKVVQGSKKSKSPSDGLELIPFIVEAIKNQQKQIEENQRIIDLLK